MKKFYSFVFGILFLGSIVLLGKNDNAYAQTVPDELMYEGQLFDSANNPITTNHVIRISLWKSSDFVPADLSGGAINTGSANYGGWTEVQNFTPAFNGSFSVQLGAVTPMPVVDFDDQKFFQIEIKAFGDPDTDYEILDPTGDGGADLVDRQKIGSVLYAKNAEKVQDVGVGTDSGDLAILGTGGKFDSSQIPGGTNEDSFVLDKNNDAAGNIVLTFGDLLGKNLFWNAISSWFEFNDTLRVDGDLIVTGSLVLSDKNISKIISPMYSGGTFSADGSLNIGTMREGKGVFSGLEKNILTWTSREAALQDYDISIRYKLPDNFKSFQANAFGINFKTDGVVTDAKIDFQVEKEGLAGNQINGAAGDNITRGTFGLQNFTLNGATPWSAGDIVLIKVKTYSKDSSVVTLGDIEINTVR